MGGTLLVGPSVIPVPDAAAPAELTAEVAEIETLPRFDRDAAGQRALRAATEAGRLGLIELELRARLVQADVLSRRGSIAEAGRIAQDVHRWATDHDHDYLVARSHYVLQGVFQDLGDDSLALEHAVRAVDLLGENGPPLLRIDHLVRLADCLAINGDPEGARERYPEVLRLAEGIGDIDRQLVILNNRAYVEAIEGEFETALRYSTQLRNLATRHGIALHVGRLDTIARALMGLGRLEEAEDVLQPGLRPEALRASPDGDAGADCLLTLTEIQRQRGRLEQARETLAQCVRLCDERGFTAIRVRTRREQAELHAAFGNFRAAFEEAKLYSRDIMELQSSQRDARARTLQAMYETTEARRQSRRYRELSLRDPLTGLYNRRYVDEELPRLLGREGEPGSPGDAAPVVSVALLDLDHFKRINDTYSHDVGDRVLREIAGLLETAVSAAGLAAGVGSFVARMGGEEFLLVLVGGDAETARRQMDDVRRAVRAHPWSELTGALPVTVSIGVTTTAGASVPPSQAALLGRADARLYQAKRQGRDRVVTDAG